MKRKRKHTDPTEQREFPKGLHHLTFDVEVRAEGDGENERKKIVGYAAKFNKESQRMGWFIEIIRPGAFTPALESSDVRALWNHNDDFVLGRTKSGTLKLVQDDIGLWVEIDPPDTQWANDLILSIERGDVDQMSFAFSDVTDRRTDDGDTVIRELLEVRKLYDVSPVTYPAYEDTEVFVRKMQLGIPLDETDKKAIRAWLDDETSASDESDSAQAGEENSEDDTTEEDPAPAGRPDQVRRRQLELAEAE